MIRRSIVARLTAGGVLILLALLSITWLAAASFSRLMGAVTQVQEHALRELALYEDMRVLISDAVHQDRAYMLSGGDDVYDEVFEADIEEIHRLIELHAALHAQVPATPGEAAAIADLRSVVDQLAGVHDEVEELVVEGRIAEARRLSEQEAPEAGRRARVAVRRLVNTERADAAQAAARAAQGARRAQRGILAVALLAAALSGAVAISVVRSVTVPVRRLVETTRRVNAGDLSARAGWRGGDEIGELAASFDGMVDRLERTFAEQQRFLTDVSHELRTPITIVRGHLEVLGRQASPTVRVDSALGLVLDELDRMTRLVTDLLVLARSTHPDFLTVAPIALPEFLMMVIQKAEAIAPRRWELGPVPQVRMVGDRDRLTQALLNLLRNAAEHTAPGQRIELAASADEGHVAIVVADEGEGIPSDVLPHIFDRFRGAHNGGFGLGLSIVQAIVRAHGGEVRVESRQGRGTRVTLLLPAHDPARPIADGGPRAAVVS